MYCGMYWYVSCTYDVLVPTNTYPYGHQYVDQYAQNTCQYGHQCLPIRCHYMPLRAPLGAGYIACDSPYNLAPPPRGPGGTARARRDRAGPAMPRAPRAPGGAARARRCRAQELRRCNSVVVGALRPRQRLEALECLHCLGSPLVDEGSSWKSPATKNKLSAAKQQSKPHASINRMVSFPQALSMTSSMDACAALSLTSSMDADKDKEQPYTDNTCAEANLASCPSSKGRVTVVTVGAGPPGPDPGRRLGVRTRRHHSRS